MRRAAAFIREAGGVEVRACSRACGSRCSRSGRGRRCRRSRPSRSCSPPRAPLSIYSFGCWARQTIVALSIVTALRPRGGSLRDRRARGTALPPAPPTDAWGRAFLLLDRAPPRLRARRPSRRATSSRSPRRRALGRRAPGARRLLGRDPAAVGLVDRRPPRARLRPRSSGDRRALAGLDAFTIEDELGRRLEACQSPVWDTALSVIALLDAGSPPPIRPSCAPRDWLAGAGGLACAATGPSAGRSSPPAASRSSSRTRTTPTSTTPPSSCSRSAAQAEIPPARPPAGLNGSLGMQSRSGGSGRSTSTTRAASARGSPSATSGQSPIRRAPT